MKLSLITKVPLRISLLIIIVGTVVTISVMFGAYRVFKDDLLLSSENMGRILSQSLTNAMLQDDTWKAYEIINTPFRIETEKGSLQADHVIVLDANFQVYISTRPLDYPMLTDPTESDPELIPLVERLRSQTKISQFTYSKSAFGHRYVFTPIVSDNVLLGAVVMFYSSEIFVDRFITFTKLASGTLLIMVFLMLPVGAYWGRHIAQPLIELSNHMGKVGDLEQAQGYTIQATGDELEHLGHQFVAMVEELHEKSLLEQQMVSTQRLAAIGRFTAGIAHEINNPLGGMLNALNTLERHGTHDPQTQKTMKLIERGLLQIRDTVAALLVEASPDHHPLSHQDIEDTRTLVLQEATKQQIHITLNNALIDQIPLPSTLIRQALINLLLNAINATPEKGHIDCDVTLIDNHLCIAVTNDGDEISEEILNHLFEPFTSETKNGRGLGLWVTYQIIETLGGDIEVSTGTEYTQFTLRIPLPLEDAA